MKRALVTGAGKRLGRDMAIYLPDRGYDVAIHYCQLCRCRRRDRGGKCAPKGSAQVTLQADLLSESQSQPLLHPAHKALGEQYISTES